MLSSLSTPAAHACDILDALEATDLAPSPRVDELFSQLVHLALTTPHLGPECTPDFLERSRSVCSEGESRLEQHWTRAVLNSAVAIESFPYRSNYRALAAYEYDAIRRVAPHTSRWAFVGSGPLPLSVVDLAALAPSSHFTCIDVSASSSDLGEKLCAQMGLTHATSHVCADAMTVDYGSFDVVVVAALVGHDVPAKMALLDHISRTCPATTTIAARSVPADGRQLLYPMLGTWPQSQRDVCEPSPPDGVVNSVVVHSPHNGR